MAFPEHNSLKTRKKELIVFPYKRSILVVDPKMSPKHPCQIVTNGWVVMFSQLKFIKIVSWEAHPPHKGSRRKRQAKPPLFYSFCSHLCLEFIMKLWLPSNESCLKSCHFRYTRGFSVDIHRNVIRCSICRSK